MTQRRKSKKTEAEPRRVNRRTFLAGRMGELSGMDSNGFFLGG